METQKLQLNGIEEIKSGNRSQVYALLARSFRFPSEEEFRSVKDGQLASAAQQSIATLPYNGLKGGELGRGMAASYEEFQSAYIGLFEVGGELGAMSRARGSSSRTGTTCCDNEEVGAGATATATTCTQPGIARHDVWPQ